MILVFRSYNVNNLMDDLKVLYRVAGADGKGITFLFTDNEIKDEAFLEFINNVLSSGEVANLFAKDEIDEIQQSLISVMKKEMPKRPPTSENLYDYFLSRAKNNLHVVLCFSPVSRNLTLNAFYGAVCQKLCLICDDQKCVAKLSVPPARRKGACKTHGLLGQSSTPNFYQT